MRGLMNRKTVLTFGLLAIVGVLVATICYITNLFAPEPTTSPTSSPEVRGEEPGLQVVDIFEPAGPYLVDQSPAPGQELALDGIIQLEFDQAMDPDSVAEELKVVGPDQQEVPGELLWINPRTIEFTPNSPLEPGSTYMVRLGAAARSSDGLELGTPLELQYQTVGELQVSQVFPADGSRHVESRSVITVIFNRPVVPLVVAEEKPDLPQPLEIDPSVDGQGEWVSTSVYAFKADGLAGATTYTVRIDAGLQDAMGDTRLADDYEWSFTTAANRIGSLDLKSGVSNPNKGMQNVLLDEAFTITFNQAMDAESTLAHTSLVSQNGENVLLTSSWDEDLTRLTITPTQRLALDTQYVLTVDPAAQAESGGSLEEGLQWSFKTVPPPSVVSTVPRDGLIQTQYSGEITIKFASPMRIDTVRERIVITPEPEKEVEWYYNEWDWSISSYQLAPSTSYEVRILPGMQDIYGNSMQEGRTVRFTTAAYEPFGYLQMPYMASIFRAGIEQEFYANYLNIRNIEFKLYRLSSRQFVSFLSGSASQWEYQPPAEDLVWSVEDTSTAGLNESVLKSYRMAGPDGGPLPPGFYFLTFFSPQMRHETPFQDTRLVIVATANLTFKSTGSDALVWLTDLESGEPIEGVDVTLYDQQFETIAGGVTNSDGLVYVGVAPAKDPYESRFALAEGSADTPVFAFASSQWGSGVSTYDYGLWSSFYSPPNQPAVYVYTDRPIYRPGQPVYFKGIVRLDDDLDYSLPDFDQVRVRVDSFEETIYEVDLPLSEYGSFDGEVMLDREAVLGTYSINILLPDQEEFVGGVSFNVAEYRRPEYKVEVSAAQENVLTGENIELAVSAEYYSGGAVADAEVAWSVQADPFYFTPADDLSSFSFMDDEIDREDFFEEPPSSRIIAEGVGRTGADGRFTLSLPADLSEFKTSMVFKFEASLTDQAGSSVSGRTDVIVHQSSVYVGVRPASYVGVAGEEQAFELVTVDWDGNPLADRTVDVEVVERRWHSVQEQDAQGRIQWTTSVEEIPVTSGLQVSVDSEGKATISYIPPNGGVFRAKVSTRDERGNEARASAYQWVAGDEFIPWRQTNDRSFELVADRELYSPGDTAEILIASPFQGEVYALVTVERGSIRSHEVILLENNSTIYRLSVTPDMAPNVYVSVAVIKGIDETNSRPNFRMGITELTVETRAQQVTVEVIPDRTEAGPGETVTYAVLTRDAQGRPVNAEVSLGLSDLATLSLVGPNSAPIMDYFYSRRTLNVWTTIPIMLNIEDFNAEIQEHVATGQGGGSGGAKGEGELGVIDVREEFPDTAFWEAHLVTGEAGEASVSVTLPDNLTTWRMDARAVTLDTRVGQTIQDLVSTKPLLVRPQTPRFFVTGDEALIGAALHNNTDQAMSVQVSLGVEGASLQGPEAQKLEIAPQQQAYVTWNIQVSPDANRVDLLFVADGQDAQGVSYQDATRPTSGTLDEGLMGGIPVYRFEARETVGTSGQMEDGGTKIEAIGLPTRYETYAGELVIEVAPSLAAGMTDGLTYLEHYPYECVEQTISRFLPNILSLRALKTAGLSDPELEARLAEQVNVALQRLYNWQNADGGWGWWSSQMSDPMTSAYVILGLTEAREAAYSVDENAWQRGIDFLRRQVKPVARLDKPYLLNRQAFFLYVLARSGNPDVSRAVQLFDERRDMAFFARAFLAQTLHLIDPADDRIVAILSDFNNSAILSATGTHWEEGEDDLLNWNTNTRSTAIILTALSNIDARNPLNANAVRWLMSHRTKGYWGSTQETAWTLMGLSNWMMASGELKADYQFGVAFNGEQIGGGSANMENLRETYELRVDINRMLRGEANRLALARDAGPGNLYYTAHLIIFLPVEEVRPLDQGIIVSRNYYPLADDPTQARFMDPIIEAAQGDLLLARLTIIAPHDLHYLLVDDPLPAGFEAVDQSLLTSPQNIAPEAYRWEDLVTQGWGWWYFDHVQLRDEKVVLSADYLPAGTYVYTYLVRAGTPGTYRVIPPTAQEFYFPEVYGRGAGGLFSVLP